MKFYIKVWITLFCINIFSLGRAQEALPLNWHLLDKTQDGLNGVSSEKAYSELLKGKKAKTIIVAILDSGVDFKHEDLKDVMWVNTKEIPGNNIDDDHNGYVDDINGWNFIGGKSGNVGTDTYETTRLYSQMKYKYESASRDNLTNKQKKDFDLYLKLKSDVESRRKSAQANLDNIEQSESTIIGAIDALSTALGNKPLTMENVDSINEGDSKNLTMGVAIARQILKDNNTAIPSVSDLKKFILQDFKEGKDHYSNELNYAFNPDFNPRTIVGDDYNNVNEHFYGNNDVQGPDALHGTHVAGLIAAKRSNGLGMDGIADHVRIMSVRCVPDGDERDKDVANAIRYAVDNGASIINMSFGKGYSPSKETVDEAVKYAVKHDVLLVHASGNAGTDNDQGENFPSKNYLHKKFLGCNKAPNWLEVGASTFEPAPDMIAGFSNYGKKTVDLFSPGVQIYSTIPGNKYESLQGTSMASPIAAGVAAMIRSYFPTLTAEQVKDILVKSAIQNQELNKLPGSKKEVKLSEISVSGGTINAYEAVKLAMKTKGKKKIAASEMYDDETVKNPVNPRS